MVILFPENQLLLNHRIVIEIKFLRESDEPLEANHKTVHNNTVQRTPLRTLIDQIDAVVQVNALTSSSHCRFEQHFLCPTEKAFRHDLTPTMDLINGPDCCLRCHLSGSGCLEVTEPPALARPRLHQENTDNSLTYMTKTAFFKSKIPWERDSLLIK